MELMIDGDAMILYGTTEPNKTTKVIDEDIITANESSTSTVIRDTETRYTQLSFSDNVDIVSHDLDKRFDEIWARLNKTVALVHNCANCGARLEIEENRPVINCKYCGSVYLVGSVQPNSTY